MKTAKYIYIIMMNILAITAGIMIYQGWLRFGLLLLLISVSALVNLIDIIDNNKETEFAKNAKQYSRRRNFNKDLITKEKQLSQIKK